MKINRYEVTITDEKKIEIETEFGYYYSPTMSDNPTTYNDKRALCEIIIGLMKELKYTNELIKGLQKENENL